MLTGTILFFLLLPLFVVIYLLLLFFNRGEPFFLQARPGKDEKIFTVIKFRTMNNNRDWQGNLLPDEYRLTTFGKWLRKTSLDEIPQLLNVIKGDMSIVGPRPLLTEYLPLYNEVQKKRHSVRPGITGWAQINGRNAISWEQKFAYDIYYTEHISFGVDFKILLRSFVKVFKSEGISAEGQATIEKFTGSI